jgi:hypothetical protein
MEAVDFQSSARMVCGRRSDRGKLRDDGLAGATTPCGAAQDKAADPLRYRTLLHLERQSVALLSRLARRLRLTPHFKLDKKPAD